MTGKYSSAQDLNSILQMTLTYLHEYQIQNWFISYGTLLGITRNNSCIEQDDDVDIIIDISEKEKLERLILEKGLGYSIRNSYILKVIISPKQPTVDFYISTMKNDKDFHDVWNKVIWTNCLPISQKEWNGTLLQLPHDVETKLKNRYGDDWMIPKKSKGVSPPKREV